MLELTAAQSLIALPPVGCITGIGIASAVFTYHLVKLLVKPYIDLKLAANSYRVQLRRIVSYLDEHEGKLTMDERAGI